MLRRSFLSRFPAAAALFGLQTPQSASMSRPRVWEPAHHERAIGDGGQKKWCRPRVIA